jgi:hypothetical protein
MECIYATKRRKRGPAKRKTLAQLKLEADAALAAALEKEQCGPRMPANTLLLESQLEHSYTYASAIDAYEAHVELFVFYGISNIPARTIGTFFVTFACPFCLVDDFSIFFLFFSFAPYSKVQAIDRPCQDAIHERGDCKRRTRYGT